MFSIINGFNYYIKKLEPEILRYYVTLYHNRNYTEEFESTEDCKFTLMIKGLKKMCIALIKNKFSEQCCFVPRNDEKPLYGGIISLQAWHRTVQKTVTASEAWQSYYNDEKKGNGVIF